MRRRPRRAWHAGQACPGGPAALEPPGAPGAGAILSSQHSGHSGCGRPCRPCPCSQTTYAAPAASSKFRPPPKGRPGALGMRRCIGSPVLGKAARPGGDRNEPAPSSVTPSGPAWRQGQPHSTRIRRSPARTQADISHAMPPALVTHRAREPPIWAVSDSWQSRVKSARNWPICGCWQPTSAEPGTPGPGARRAVTRGHPPVPPPHHCGRRRQPLPSGTAGHAAPGPTSLRSDEHAAAVYGEDGASRVLLLHKVQVAARQIARLADSADRQRAAVRAEQFVPHVRRELPPQLGAH